MGSVVASVGHSVGTPPHLRACHSGKPDIGRFETADRSPSTHSREKALLVALRLRRFGSLNRRTLWSKRAAISALQRLQTMRRSASCPAGSRTVQSLVAGAAHKWQRRAFIGFPFPYQMDRYTPRGAHVRPLTSLWARDAESPQRSESCLRHSARCGLCHPRLGDGRRGYPNSVLVGAVGLETC